MRGGKSLVTNSVRNASPLGALPVRSSSRYGRHDMPRRERGAPRYRDAGCVTLPWARPASLRRPAGRRVRQAAGRAPCRRGCGGRQRDRHGEPAGGRRRRSCRPPPLRSARRRQTQSPIPRPGVRASSGAAPRKPNSPARRSSSSAMPGPSSDTVSGHGPGGDGGAAGTPAEGDLDAPAVAPMRGRVAQERAQDQAQILAVRQGGRRVARDADLAVVGVAAQGEGDRLFRDLVERHGAGLRRRRAAVHPAALRSRSRAGAPAARRCAPWSRGTRAVWA